VRYMALNRRDYTYMHDPLAVSLGVDPTFVTTESALVQVETAGEFARGMTLVSRPADGRGNARVAMTVAVPRFMRFLLERLRQGPARPRTA
jgi:inosine-uridine nucleoside N-ribohydrolase